MVIAHNMMAYDTCKRLNINNEKKTKTCAKLSTGYRITTAADDAAGLSVSEKMRSQIRGLNRATANAQDGISLIQAAEGSMAEIQNMLQRMRELYVQNCNGTYSQEDRENIFQEVSGLYEDIDKIANGATYNQRKLFDGTLTDLEIQVGNDDSDIVKISIPDFKNISDSDVFCGEDIFGAVIDLGGSSMAYSADRFLASYAETNFLNPDGIDSLTGIKNSKATLNALSYSIDKVSEARANLGALQNKLESIISNNNTTSENMQAAESRIRDADMASEMMNFTKTNILEQSAEAVLAQANQSGESVLSLLK